MKTYTLQSTGVCRYARSSYDANWSMSASGGYGQVGKVSGYYTCLGYYFDETTLALLRTKSVASITLRVKTQNYPTFSGFIEIAYALSNSPASCKRSNADSTAASTSPIGDIYSLPHVTADAYTTLTLTGSSVPKYGYLIGPHGTTSLTDAYVLLDNSVCASSGFAPATLTVVTNEATITYDANGGTNAPAAQDFSTTGSVTLSAYAPTREGYSFRGWATSSDAASPAYAAGGSYTFNGDVTLYAVWQQATYTISYNANGGSGAPEPQTKTHGTDLTLSSTEPTREGYGFAGWGLSADAQTAAYAAGATFSLNADTALYAVWSAELANYTVTYDANGGTGAPEVQTKSYGTDLALSSVIPTRIGYTFLGWALAADATAAQYDPGDTYTTNANAVLYAVWEALLYTVAFNANGGAGAPASQTKRFGTVLTLSSTQPTREGYTFLGWSGAGDSAVVLYLPNSRYDADASISLYAVWSAVPVTRTLTYDANGGENAPEPQSAVWDDETQPDFTVTDAAPSRDGFLFCGWAASSDGDVSYLGGDTLPARFDKTLYAVWVPIRSRRDLPVYFCGTRDARTEPIYQYNYGQGLTFPDADLPDAYEVHFSASERGVSYTVIGDASGVAIPDELLTEGVPVLAWIVLHSGADDGETVYRIVIPVIRRAKPSVAVPAPQEQSVIAQTIAALQTAVAKIDAKLPALPLTGGDYVLRVTAADGDIAYTWIPA